MQDSAIIAPRWTLTGIIEGMRASLVVLPSLAMFAAGFGAVAAQKGLTLFEATMMSAVVYAGVSQFVAMEGWTGQFTLAGLATITAITMIVNLRFVLLGGALRPWLGPLPAWQVYPSLFFLSDAGWLMAMRYRAEGGNDAGYFLGTGLARWTAWIIATVPGYLAGAAVADPHRFGLDMIMPAFFSALLVPLWRGPRRALSWLIAGLVAVTLAQLTSGWWFIVVGALAGSIVGGWIDDRD